MHGRAAVVCARRLARFRLIRLRHPLQHTRLLPLACGVIACDGVHKQLRPRYEKLKHFIFILFIYLFIYLLI